jgi:hypothetical protein
MGRCAPWRGRYRLLVGVGIAIDRARLPHRDQHRRLRPLALKRSDADLARDGINVNEPRRAELAAYGGPRICFAP